MEDFGKRLKELRMQHRMTQEEMARRLGVTSEAVSDWETGKSSPSYESSASKQDFGKRLKELRTRHHLSQEEMAKRLGVTSQAVSKWENGRSTPDFSVIIPLARLFHITTDQLLDYEGPIQDWELHWQIAMRVGDPAEARRIAEEAQQTQQPMTGHFSLRQAEAEIVLARDAKDPAERKRLLASVERRLWAILREYPEYEGAAMTLAGVLLKQGRRQEAETLAQSYPNGVFNLLLWLKGEATEEQRVRAITARAAQFMTLLIDSGDLRALDLAEKFFMDFPWVPADRANLLSNVFVERACLLCSKGDPDGAMAALERLRELMHPVEEDGASGAPLTFLRLMPGQDPSEEWVYGLGLLKDHRLKPLEEREEYRALLALAEKRLKKEA